jgi:hypothetical protein
MQDGKMEIFLVNKEATTIDGAIYICIEVLLLSVYVPGSLDTGRVVAFMRFAWFVHLPGGLHHMQGRDVTGQLAFMCAPPSCRSSWHALILFAAQ